MKIKKLFNYLLFFVFVLLSYTPVYAEEIVLKNARVVEKYGTPSIETISIDNNTITSGIKFNNINEFVTLELELENNSNNSIELESIENLISSNYLNVETDSIGTIINRSSSNNIRVKITYNNELLNQDEIYFRDASIKFNFSVIPMENPNTSSALVIIIKIVLLINIGFSLFILLKRKKKLAFLGLFFIPLLVYAKDSKEVIINFDDIRAKGRFEEYSVIITNENGEIEERTITYGEPVELPTNVSKTGYNFTGWVDQNGNSINNGDIITGETEITPTFEIISYTITYNLNNGTLSTSNPTTYTIEDEFTLNNPTRVGYSFSGWMEGNDGVIVSSMTIYQGTTGNKTFTAIYSPNPDTSYKVIHKKMDLNGEYGDDVEEETLHGSTGSQVTPQRRGYTGFIAPEGQKVTIAGDGSTTVTYYYEREQYTFRITDRTYIVSAIEDGQYYYGTTISITADERVGYDFKWNDNNTDYEREFTLTGNTILTPIYTAKNVRYYIYHCYMNLDGETYYCGSSTQSTAKADSTVVAYINSREGFTDPEPETITIAADGSTKHRYYYTRNKYQLTLTDSEYITTSTPSGEYFYETNISLTAKTREGYTFTKWSDDSVSNPYSFKLLGDKTIGPVYSRNKYTITLDPNGGSVDQNEILVDIGSSIGTLPTPTINKNHTTFSGWFTGVETGDEVTENTIPEGNITIYARWEYHPEATFEYGPTVNSRIKNMSGNITNANQNTNDNNLEQIKVGESLPNDFTPSTANTISTNNSDEAIYIWYDSNDKIMYYYTDAEKIYLNKSATVMFRNIRKLNSIENINNWDTSKTTDMSMLFASTGYNATTFEIDLSNWNTSNVTSMLQMFSSVGYNATTWSIGDLSNWDTSKVTNMSFMFSNVGFKATTWSIGDLSNWNVSNVTDMASMFYYAGYNATTFDIGDLSEWNTSNVTTMSSMFYNAGRSATTWSIGDLSEWNTSNVTTMSSMFTSAGYTAESFVLDLSTWNVSSVTSMSQMFSNAGRSATTWSIGDLSNWDTLNVTNMYGMFEYAGYSATTWNSIGTLKIYADDLRQMFSYCKKAKVTLNIYNNPSKYGPSGYFMFFYAATNSDALITVNYTNTTTNIDDIIATKSNSSNVVKGSLITTS